MNKKKKGGSQKDSVPSSVYQHGYVSLLWETQHIVIIKIKFGSCYLHTFFKFSTFELDDLKMITKKIKNNQKVWER